MNKKLILIAVTAIFVCSIMSCGGSKQAANTPAQDTDSFGKGAKEPPCGDIYEDGYFTATGFASGDAAQKAFSYKTDQDNYGFEKWNFAEETLVNRYSDCDDRAIFFTQLVKNLLGMKVVLVHYPGLHLAAAVRFDNPQTDGDHVIVNNTKYLICDPTYINANLGMEMPKLKGVKMEIIQ
jgi:hypothetical protein